jgi:hypothetical protein
MAGLLIGEVAQRTGVSPPTIRYYANATLDTAAANVQLAPGHSRPREARDRG